MSRIIKNCPCTLEVWSGPDEPILKEWNMYFNCKNEIKEYLNSKLQEFKGNMVECYVYQLHKGKLSEVLVCFAVK